MDLWEAVVVSFRRWYVMVPILIVGVFIALRLAESVSPVHEAGANIQFIPSPTSTPEEADLARANPYSDLRSLAIAVELTATAESFTRGLSESGLDADFTMTTDPRLPVLYITTVSTSSEAALDTLSALVDFAEEEARARQVEQFGADESLFVRSDPLRVDSNTTIDLTSRTRARILLLIVAGVVAVGSSVAVESVIGALRRRRGGSDDDEVAEPAVVWFGVPVQAGQHPPSAPPIQQPYLAPAPEDPPRLTGTDGDGDVDVDVSGSSRSTRWSR